MRVKKLFAISLIFLGITKGSSGQTLDDYLQFAAENNPALQSKFAEFEASLQRVAQVNALPDPRISFGVFLRPIETRNGPQQSKIGLSQMFPWIGTLRVKGQIATLQAEVKFEEFNQEKYKLFFHVKEAWYPLNELYSTLKLHEQNRAILVSLKRLATSRYKNGKGSMVDVIRVDIMIENTQTEIGLLQAKKKPLLTRFNRLLNRPDTSEVVVSDTIDLSIVSMGYRRDSLLALHPGLLALKLKHEAAIASEELANKAAMPSFGLGIDYVFVGKRTDINPSGNGNNAVMPMVTMSIPVNQRKYKAAIRETQFVQESIANQIESFENKLSSEYELVWYQLTEAIQLSDLFSNQIEKTNQAIRLLSASYNNSGQDFEEILRMQQELLKYQIAQATAKKNFETALAKLDYLTTKYE